MGKNLILTLLGLTVAMMVSAQTPPGSPGAAQGERHPVASPAAIKHDAAVEAVLLVKQASLGTAFSSPQAPGASVVPIEIEFLNNSQQAITAFAYRLRIRFSDGREAPNEGSEDLIKSMAAARLQPEIADPNSSFSPRGIRTITRNLAFRSGGALPASLEVFPSMVILEDRTALGDPNEIAKAVTYRKTEAEYMARLLADLDSVAASSDPAAALASRIAQLKKEGPSGPHSRQAKDLEGFSDMVGLFGKISNGHDIGREALKGQLDEMRAQQKMLAEHSSLKRTE